jgi:hypothetical protein
VIVCTYGNTCVSSSSRPNYRVGLGLLASHYILISPHSLTCLDSLPLRFFLLLPWSLERGGGHGHAEVLAVTANDSGCSTEITHWHIRQQTEAEIPGQ